MVRCSEGCIPKCQDCIYAEYEQIEVFGEPDTFDGEANGCKIHPENEVNATYWCDDFHCQMAEQK